MHKVYLWVYGPMEQMNSPRFNVIEIANIKMKQSISLKWSNSTTLLQAFKIGSLIMAKSPQLEMKYYGKK